MPDAKDIYDYFISKHGAFTDVQKASFGIIEKGLNCLIISGTGTGKTEAAMLPAIKMLKERGSAPISVLYITPLRALNRDMLGRFEELCEHSGLKVGVRHGDTKQSERSRQIRNPPDIMITTPETLQSILPTKYIGEYLKNLKVVIVDEVHELYYSKRGAQLSVALERLVERAGDFQRIGISATVDDDDVVAKFLCGRRDCVISRVDAQRVPDIRIELPRSVPQSSRNREFEEFFGLDEGSFARIYAIVEHIKKSDSCLIFGNTRQVVEALGSRLLYLDKLESFGGIGVHHGSLDKDERAELEAVFKKRGKKAIISTSSLELGIDIGSIDFVVQYGSPKQALRLLQRMGRSGHSIRKISKGSVIALNEVDYIESMAVLENARNGELESFSPNFGALDIAAHQICGLLAENGATDLKRIKDIFERSFVYKDIKEEELLTLLKFMHEQHMILLDDKLCRGTGRTRMYYYEHLSAIPDSIRFKVKNIANGKIVSFLDEKFVLGNVSESSVFITKGLPWKVIDIEKDVITVEPCTDVSAAVPDWYGEDIPVSFSVAQRFLDIIERAAGFGARAVDELVLGQLAFFPLKRGTVAVENMEGYTVIYTFLGTRANEFISKLLGTMITKRTGSSANTKASPYLIFVESDRFDMKAVLSDISGSNIDKTAESVITGTSLFNYKFVEIAKRFGIIERGASLSKNTAKKIVEIFKGTPVWLEAYREIRDNYFDYKVVKGFFDDIRKGTLRLEKFSSGKLSPLSDSILNSDYHTKELIMPIRPNAALLESFIQFTSSKKAKLLCTYCGLSFQRKILEVQDVEKLECPNCKSAMLCTYTDNYRKVISESKGKKKMTRADMKAYSEMMIEARLFRSYGGKAAVALATYGVGPRTAARALKMQRDDHRLFYTDLIDAQKNFIKNKKYWMHR